MQASLPQTDARPLPVGVDLAGARRTVAWFVSLEDARRAVRYLESQRFPAQRAQVVAEGLRLVDAPRGGAKGAAANGALAGAGFGAFVALVLGLLGVAQGASGLATLGFFGVAYGALAGAVIGLGGFEAACGPRGWSQLGVRPDRYALVVDAELSAEAARLLARTR